MNKMESEIDTTIQLMCNLYDLDISMYDVSFLKQATDKRRAATQNDTLPAYVKYLSGDSAEARNLFDSLNITYTEFFRNSLSFANLEHWILPDLINGKSENQELRIWSAGCSSGQEAYSIAMQVENILTKNPNSFRYRVIATDISESALSVARKGEYNQDAIQNIRTKDLNNFFEKSGTMYKVSERLKNQVSFSSYDLLDTLTSSPQESIFGNFDIVICSNLLFYYQPEIQQNILKKLINSMAENGYLITGEAEKHVAKLLGSLRMIAPPSAIFQKECRGTQ